MDDVDVDGVAGSDIRLWLFVELDAEDPRREGEGEASGVDGTSERRFGVAVAVVDDRAERGFVVVVGEGGTATEVVVGPIERGRGFVARRVVVVVGFVVVVVVEIAVLARRVTAAVGSGAGGGPLLLVEIADMGLIPSSANVDRRFGGCFCCIVVGAVAIRDAISVAMDDIG